MAPTGNSSVAFNTTAFCKNISGSGFKSRDKGIASNTSKYEGWGHDTQIFGRGIPRTIALCGPMV
eukprot:7449758-Karenia_brevis.AAC.1